MAAVLNERVARFLDRLGLLPAAFRVYQGLGGFNPRVVLNNRSYRVSGEEIPVPPARLLMTVAGSAEVAVFLEGGRRAAASIRQLLGRNGIAIESLQSILDFGCGCGRVLRHWKGLPVSELHGTDYNAELARWCARHLPFARIGTNELAPPTSYPAAKFDFIYTLSVFTHLPESAQAAWMNEFHRILRPGGLLLLSLHGEHYTPRLTEQERTQFRSGALVTRHHTSAGTNLCNAFHPELYVRNHLARAFEVVDFVPEGALGNPRQDAWLFRRA